jgi:hypothetical protein
MIPGNTAFQADFTAREPDSKTDEHGAGNLPEQ